GRGPTAQPRLRHGTPELRHERIVHQPGDRAAGALAEPGRLPERSSGAAQAPGRDGRSTAPVQARRAPDVTHEGPGRLPRRPRGRTVQARPLSLLRRARRARRPLKPTTTARWARLWVRAADDTRC